MSSAEVFLLVMAIGIVALLLFANGRTKEPALPDADHPVSLPEIDDRFGRERLDQMVEQGEEGESILAPPPDFRFHQPEREITDPQTGLLLVDEYGFRDHSDPHQVEDANDFYDELFVQFAHRTTGATWISHYVVATPAGLARKMRDDGVRSMLNFQGLVVNRYDAEIVLLELLTHISAEMENLPVAE